MWPFKPKLKLNFYDPEYEDLMNLFKQMNYVRDIITALEEKTDDVDYVKGILNSFISIYGTISERIRKNHKRKPLDFNYINWDRLEHDLKPFNKTIEGFKQTKEPYKSLLQEMHGVMREHSYNKIVSDTYVKVFLGMTHAIIHLNAFPSEKTDMLCNLYGKSYVRFLGIIHKNIKLYRDIGSWLKQDQKALEAYKPYLTKRIQIATDGSQK